ncbi:MAG: hypothetical protein KC731_01670 [Myxococcales bacterium]|nr:hypothetical protein [Myxococcales bacterium]
MNRLARACLPLLGFLAVAAACGDDPSGSGGSGGSGAAGGSGGAGAAGGGGTITCAGTFHDLQKDAYKETAGRTSALWPPHTTTVLDWSCEGSGDAASSFRANHGTEPGATDANGDVYLVEVATTAVTGDPAALAALTQAYDACECGTSFLSLDALQETAVQDLVAELSSYIEANLTCTGAVDAAGLVMLLQQGDIEAVITALPNCSWAGGTGFEGGFDEALQAVIDAAGETLADYHVCNNDAALQAKLIDAFVASGEVAACDPDDALCHGPLWFYEP